MRCAMLGRATHRGFFIALLLLTPAATPLWAAGGGGGGGDMNVESKPIDADYSSAVKDIQLGKFDEAIGLLQRVLTRDARNADAYNYLGYANRKLGNREAA